MIFRTPDIKKKHELEAQGHRCRGMHTIYNGKVPTGNFEYEFDLPETPDTNKIEPIKQKPRGNPNWIKKDKKK
jgi:hypothetical protein